jgi:hypothetical protein
MKFLALRAAALGLLFPAVALSMLAPPPPEPSERYTVDAGTVIDERTGLTWQRAIPAASSWANANTYCATLNLNGTGWRLPSLKELMTLVDFTVTGAGAKIDVGAFPATPAGFFWSTPTGRGVSFNGGFGAAVSLPGNQNVRCVR